jgi:hypothetical protein
VASAFDVPTKLKLFIIAMSPYLPHRLLDLMYDYLPGEGLSRTRENRRVATKAAKDLVESKIQETRDGKSGRDILTLLGEVIPCWLLERVLTTVGYPGDSKSK